MKHGFSNACNMKGAIIKKWNDILANTRISLTNTIPASRKITTSDNKVTLINWWSVDSDVCNCDREWLYLFIKNNTDIKHLNIFSVFGNKRYVTKFASKKDIFFSAENLDENFGLRAEYADYCLDYVGLSMGFAQRSESNYLRFPLWLLYTFEPFADKDLIAKRVAFINNSNFAPSKQAINLVNTVLRS